MYLGWIGLGIMKNRGLEMNVKKVLYEKVARNRNEWRMIVTQF